ncbi:hypothetical protein RHGRI_003529 [Rhododendron griersonianum]|uniref:Uncharacterized protein n=1 Tax=Rhododendron griersonianum TaxID=479676 RepID=A0AAV6L5D2_9ERIC|nr:hypothetical protein RHGRI_003529 [Rhododendron griersonianum]
MARATWSKKTQKMAKTQRMAVARPTRPIFVFDSIYHGLAMTLEKLGRATPGKALLFAGTLTFCMEGVPALKEQLGNWLQNRRDPVAFFERRVSYLEEKLEMTESKSSIAFLSGNAIEKRGLLSLKKDNTSPAPFLWKGTMDDYYVLE